MEAAGAQRFCPICEKLVNDTLCPTDGVLTVPVSTMRGELKLPEGHVLAERYRIEGVLGGGGMAKVYRATQVSMQRPVALKVLRPGLLHDGQAIKRFYREAKAASQLSHPNIVNVHDFGVDDATQMPFLAMELVEGQSLSRLVASEGALPEARACALLAQVARALVPAHAKGVVHRDLKPDNVMVSTLPDGLEHVTVLDFGIAKVARAPGDLADSLTASGVAIGTPRYMSPEQVMGGAVDFRADLYAVGCMLHELLTGHAPFGDDEVMKVMMAHVHREPPSLPMETTSLSVRVLNAALLAKRPTERPATTAVVARILNAVAAGAEADAPTWLAEAEVVAGEAPTPRLMVTADPLRPADPLADTAASSGPVPGSSIEAPIPNPSGRRRAWLWIAPGASAAALLVLGLGWRWMAPSVVLTAERAPPVEEAGSESSGTLEARSGAETGRANPRAGSSREVGGGTGPNRADPGAGTGRAEPGAGTGPNQADPGAGTGRADPGAGTGRADPGAGTGRAEPGAGTGPNQADPAPSPDRPLVRLRSTPPGAEVYEGAERLGRTPLDLPVTSEARRIELRLAGHRVVARTLTLDDEGEMQVELRPSSKRRRRPAPEYPPLAPR